MRTVLRRVATWPLRFTPLRRRLDVGTAIELEQRRAVTWYREHARPVTIVVLVLGPPDHIIETIDSVRRTTARGKVRLVVVADADARERVEALARSADVRLVAGDRSAGFAFNANRGIAAVERAGDVVLLTSGVVASPHWLACLQCAASSHDDIGIVGAKLLFPDGRIEHAGVHRNPSAPRTLEHRFRFKPADYGPAEVAAPVLAITGACMYVKREVLERVGPFDEAQSAGVQDADWCLRAWQAGYRVVYCPSATLRHRDSDRSGTPDPGSHQRFWASWGPFFDERPVRTPSGGLRIVYVTEGTSVGGGHRDVFEQLNRMQERGHDVRLFSLGGAPDWFELDAPVETFADYAALIDALAREDAIKVATWWNTAEAVWRASVLRGIPVFLVQDIETSYYPEDEVMRRRVLAGYRDEFHYVTISGWTRARLQELGFEARLIPPGIDLQTFRPLDDVERRRAMLLALGRSNPLKNLPLTVEAWRALQEPRPQLTLFGTEPELGSRYGARYVAAPSDEAVNRLLNEATVFVQTSIHEGFCLPALEAMATGAAVVCTDADGNRDFCSDGENCLMPEPSVESVRDAIARLLADEELRRRLGEAGRRTAQDYAWDKRIDELEAFLTALAPIPASARRVP